MLWYCYVFLRLYGSENVTPKFHVAMHFPHFIRKFTLKRKTLPTCWPCERNRRVAKRWINPIVNRSIRFDRSAFRDVLGFSLSQLADKSLFGKTGLREPSVPASPQLAQALGTLFGPQDFRISRCAQVCIYEAVHWGDIVEGFNGSTRFLGRVLVHASVGKDCISILEAWDCVARTVHFSTWDTRTSSRIAVRTEDLLCACVFSHVGHTLRVLQSPRSRLRNGADASGSRG